MWLLKGLNDWDIIIPPITEAPTLPNTAIKLNNIITPYDLATHIVGTPSLKIKFEICLLSMHKSLRSMNHLIKSIYLVLIVFNLLNQSAQKGYITMDIDNTNGDTSSKNESSWSSSSSSLSSSSFVFVIKPLSSCIWRNQQKAEKRAFTFFNEICEHRCQHHVAINVHKRRLTYMNVCDFLKAWTIGISSSSDRRSTNYLIQQLN